ncbi:MAG TPA: UvrD-helicase domain-containing protein, partial [Woeseiaceae bacterium]|nr:UvrD-helicase domain-containing protein [Woeseiaceae bacterium]
MGADGNLLAADLNARADALDVARSFIVQAPAGSGKTELLIQRYLKLLAEVDHPEEVVAITFTVKAAEEMRLRAIDAIRDAGQGEPKKDEHHRVTQEAARKVLERDRAREWKLLESPGRMRIQTLDALNAGIARSLPFSSGLGSGGQIVADAELQQLYRRSAAATLDWLATDGPENASVEQVLSHLDNNTTAYIEHLARMLAKRDQWLPMSGAGFGKPGEHEAARRKLERNIAEVVTARLARVRRLLPDEHLPALTNLCRYAAGNLAADEHEVARLAECNRFPEANAEQVGLWRAVASLLLTQSGSWRKSVNKSIGFPPRDEGQKQQMLELLSLLEEQSSLAAELHRVRELPDPHYTGEQWDVLLALLQLLPLAVAELKTLFNACGATDHTEVAVAADAALGNADEPGDIGLLLDFTIRHLLIDEMQDTSIAQYRLIEKLVSGWQPGDGRTLFCVGDPMQSVYRFRDAEVGQFLLARERGIGPVSLEPLLLRQNFRSGEHLVHWYNSVFGELFPPEDDVTAGAIAYSASVPVESRRGVGARHLYPLFGASNEEEADVAADVIRRCVDVSEQETTAVLVRSRAQLPLLLGKLRESRIAYQAIEIDRLTDLPEIIDLLALTRALAHRGDRIAWLGLLRGPWVGLCWTDLHTLVFNDKRSTVWELLRDEERLRALSAGGRESLQKFGNTLAPFVSGHGTTFLRETVERAWYLLRGPLLLDNEEEVENVYRFLDVLDGLDTAGTIQDVAELEAKLDQEHVSGKAASDCRLHIMTMHKAKGLQFDHIVLYGLGRMTKGDEKSILSWLNLPDAGDGPAMLLSPVGARAELETDRLHNFIEAAEREKGRLEQDRLLYVACTRARHSVHLVGHVDLTADGSEICEPRKGTLLHSLWPSTSRSFAEAFRNRSPESSGGSARHDDAFRLPLLRRLDWDLALGTPPALPGARPGAGNAAPEPQVDFYWVGSVARHAGTILHRWLHKLTSGLLEADVARLERLLPVARTHAKELGVPVQNIDDVCRRALDALRGILGD